MYVWLLGTSCVLPPPLKVVYTVATTVNSGQVFGHQTYLWTEAGTNWRGRRTMRQLHLSNYLSKLMSSWPTCSGDWLQSSSSFGGILDCQKIVPWPAHARFPARNSLVNEVGFLGLNTKTGKDQWNCEISNYYVATRVEFVHLHSSIRSFFLSGLSAKCFERC